MLPLQHESLFRTSAWGGGECRGHNTVSLPCGCLGVTGAAGAARVSFPYEYLEDHGRCGHGVSLPPVRVFEGRGRGQRCCRHGMSI
jgi:hypothetical protein